MKLNVRHVTRYAYDAPRAAVLQSQRLVPSTCDNQTTLDWQVETAGGVEGSRFRDGAGDRTWLVRVPGPVEEVTVTVAGVVETQDFAGLLKGHREKVPPQVYLRETRATRFDKAIATLARDAVDGAAPGDGVLGQAHALCSAVAEAIRFTPDVTDAQTTAPEALERGKGVCQDHAHVLIAAALSVDIPARYVTGYLYSGGDASHPDYLVGSEASHAWAELWVEGLGWVGFDAANACCPDAHYIRLCSGFDADDAAPIRGLAAGGAAPETLDVTVAVERAQQ